MARVSNPCLEEKKNRKKNRESRKAGTQPVPRKADANIATGGLRFVVPKEPTPAPAAEKPRREKRAKVKK